jgi:hypothetical protein
VAVLLGGGAFAAVSATGASNDQRADHRAAARKLHQQDLAAAAAYLGLSSAQLSQQLSAGSSLGQIAAARASSGKSAAGLIAAIIASRRSRLEKANASLPKRVTAEVQRAGDPLTGAARAGKHLRHGKRISTLTLLLAPGHLGSAAVDYLGVSQARLQAELEAGKTLAQLAEASPGKSKAGLIDALIAARQQRLATAVAAGRLSGARSAKRAKHLDRRIEALVARKFARSAAA